MKDKKIFTNSKNKQMSIVIPKLKGNKIILKFQNDKLEAKVIIKRKVLK